MEPIAPSATIDPASWAEIARPCGATERADGAALTALIRTRLAGDPSPLHAGAACLALLGPSPQLAVGMFRRACEIDPRAGAAIESTPEARQALIWASDLFQGLALGWTPDMAAEHLVKPRRGMDLRAGSAARFAKAADMAESLSERPAWTLARAAKLVGERSGDDPFASGLPTDRLHTPFLGALLAALHAGARLPPGLDAELRRTALARAALAHPSAAAGGLAAWIEPEPRARAALLGDALRAAAIAADARPWRSTAGAGAFSWSGSDHDDGRIQACALAASHMVHFAQIAHNLPAPQAQAFWDALLLPGWEKAARADAFAPMKAFRSLKSLGGMTRFCIRMKLAADAAGTPELSLGHPAHSAWSALIQSKRSDPQAASLCAELIALMPNPEASARCMERFAPAEKAFIEAKLISVAIKAPQDAFDQDDGSPAPERRLRL